MKNIVEPQGSFILVDPYSGDTVQHGRPTVVRHTYFIDQRVANGQLKILGVVGDEATDDELVKFLKDSGDDKDLAIASFLAAFPLEAPAEEVEEVKTDETKPAPKGKK